MEIILPKISSSLSKMWTKVLNLENSLFPSLKRELQLEELSNKEQKLIKILDFAAIEKNITVVSIVNTLCNKCSCNLFSMLWSVCNRYDNQRPYR